MTENAVSAAERAALTLQKLEQKCAGVQDAQHKLAAQNDIERTMLDPVVQATYSSSPTRDLFLRVRMRCNVRRCMLRRRAVTDTLRPQAS